jgi:hypothetical protein
MSTTGCCRGLPPKDCAARPYGCGDSPQPQPMTGSRGVQMDALVERAVKAEMQRDQLLRVVKRIVAELREARDTGTSSMSRDKMISTASAAIAKAEGRP